MFDTHCHLNFKRFAVQVDEVIARAKNAGVNYFLVPGTDEISSQEAVEIAENYDGVYAAVGIHPHHVFQINQKSEVRSQKPENSDISDLSDVSGIRLPTSDYSGLSEIKQLLDNKKVVAIGEVGLDRYVYKNTKYSGYGIDEKFIELQKQYFIEQIKLAHEYKKALIIHNWEAKNELLNILTTNYLLLSTIPVVFHCCEPDKELLQFAIDHKIHIGIDGDVTYSQEKQEFVKKIPLELLVLETDSPFLLPEPFRSQKQYPNEPKNLAVVAEFIASLIHISPKILIEATTENAKRLISL